MIGRRSNALQPHNPLRRPQIYNPLRHSQPFKASSTRPKPAFEEVVIGTLDGEPLRARFPLHVELFGIAAVVIPAREFEALRARTTERQTPLRLRRKSKSPIDHDPEVARFLAESRTVLFIPEACAECERRFGASRTPSKSAVGRYWQLLDSLPGSVRRPRPARRVTRRVP